MGNECKQCTQDVQSIDFQSQHNIITQSNQYSFGMNCVDHDINFEFSSIDNPTVPQFGLESLKIKADLLPPQALKVSFEDSNISLLDLEETIEQQVNQEINCTKLLSRFQSQEENSIVQQKIKMKQITGSNLTTSSEVQLQQLQPSQRSIQKQRQLLWDSRTVNKELKQRKKAHLNSMTQFEQIDYQGSARKEKSMTHLPQELNKKKDNNQIKQSEQKIQNLNSTIQDEFLYKQINYQQKMQQKKFLKYE
ncbi:unnamed protein product [Paramecium pentaurelia]|uniref:Uncharacterized protein n=1 Tax=Paramecium pentaurelia TaxID=43138 RepID=A0A8S1SPU9_9CILI|nr:unnamed protein product [Paramecium pentaurelia]